MALMLASMLAGFLALTSRKVANGNVIHWAGIWLLFLLLSLDEVAEIHEKISDRIQDAFGFTGFLSFSWVIPGAIAVAIVTSLYLRFVFRRPPSFEI
jgi:hypothetical protein